jgi:hypothetical protein
MKLSDIQEGQIISKEDEEEILKTSQAQKTDVQKTTLRHVEIQKKVSDVEAGELSKRTKTTEFKITPHMRLWIDTSIDLCSDNVSLISDSCKVARTTWYQWLRLPGFYDFYLESYKAGRKRWLPKLDNMGMQRAAKSFDYWKAMNQKAGDLLEGEHVGITGQNVVSILGGVTINNIKQEPKEDLTGKNDKEIYGYDKQQEEGERPDKL